MFSTPFSTKMFTKDRIERISSNQSICRASPYAQVIANFFEKGNLAFSVFSIIHATLSDKPLSRATSYQQFKKLGDGVSDAPRNVLHIGIGLDVVGEFVEIEGQRS